MNEQERLRRFLSGVLEARREVRRREWEIKTLQDRCRQTTGRLGGGSRGGGDVHRDGPLAELADCRAELDRARAKLREREKQVEEFLSQLSDSRCRAVMKLRYVEMLRWAQVKKRMEELGLYYSERQIFNLHRKAMEEAAALWEKNK